VGSEFEEAEGAQTGEQAVHVASIVHITDTHLFVDEHGTTRSPRDRSRLVRVLARLGVKDLDFASGDMTAAFSQTLRRAVDLERSVLPPGAPVVAVHTGDTEAFGSSDQRHVYAGFTHLSRIVDDAGLSDTAVAVYGNHDVWPGTIALFGLNGPHHDSQKHSIADVVDLVGQLPPSAPLRFPTAAGFDVVFVPLNTVNSHPLRGALLAYGRISPHPPNPSHPQAQALDIVAAYNLCPDDLNIAVMHHPPHFYRPLTLRDRLGIGHLDDADYVACRLAAAGIDLVLAGHRHRLDPPFLETIDAAQPKQAPLPAGVAQMVAISPTLPTEASVARNDPEGSPRSGLCVYQIMASPESISLHRVIHPTDPEHDPQPIAEGPTITGLSAPRTTTTGPRP
jgi:hypothetical protein